MPIRNSANWHASFLRLEKFFNYWILRGEISALIMPDRPTRNRPTLRAFVYSKAELQRLLAATVECQAQTSCRIDAETLRMFLTLLYATGTTVCELLDLKRGDVDLRRSSIAIFNRKYGWSRAIPIGTDLRLLLSGFLKRKTPAGRRLDALFSDKMGNRIEQAQVTYSFGRLRRIARVGPTSKAALQPRLLDFRTTFAVHRIRAWLKEGVDLNRMLPALATYMGQTGLGSLDKYLDLTPERFGTHIAILSPNRGRKHWRDDPALQSLLKA